MPKRVPLQGIIVTRNGRQVQPPVGKVFDFTAEEIETLKLRNPKALRTPVNEGENKDVEAKETDLVGNKPPVKAEPAKGAAATQVAKPTTKADTKGDL